MSGRFKFTLLLPLLAIAACIPIRSTEACTCTNLGWSASQHLASSDVGFMGIVTSMDPSVVYPGFSEITFDVTGCWKGVAASPIIILTSDDPGGCGYHHFVVGERFLVFAGDGGTGSGIYSTGSCSGNQLLAPGVDPPSDLGPPGLPGECEVTPSQAMTWGTLKAQYP